MSHFYCILIFFVIEIFLQFFQYLYLEFAFTLVLLCPYVLFALVISVLLRRILALVAEHMLLGLKPIHQDQMGLCFIGSWDLATYVFLLFDCPQWAWGRGVWVFRCSHILVLHMFPYFGSSHFPSVYKVVPTFIFVVLRIAGVFMYTLHIL